MTTIITHNGKFHTDEVMAAVMITAISADPQNVDIIRTRDTSLIESKVEENNAYVIDVGGVYKPEERRFDHHQESFNDTYSDKSKIPLSSCGLIYKHYAKELWHKMCGIGEEKITQESIDSFYFKFVLPIDANDNGISDIPKDYKREYNPLTLCGLISKMNYKNVKDHETQLKSFTEAMRVCRYFLLHFMNSVYEDNLEQLKIFPICQKYYYKTEGEIMTMEEDVNISKCLDILDPERRIKFMVLPDEKTTNWKIFTRSIGNFEIEAKIIPSEEAKRIEPNNVVFMHKNQFIAITRNMDSAMHIAQVSLRDYHSIKNTFLRFMKRVNRFLPSRYTILNMSGGMILGVSSFYAYNRYF